MTLAVNALQNHTDDKLTAMLEEIKIIRLSQDFLSEKYEDMKKKLETITMTSHNLQEENNNLKSVLLYLQTRSENFFLAYLALFCFLVVSRARVHFCCALLIVWLALIVCDVVLVLCASSFVQKSLFG